MVVSVTPTPDILISNRIPLNTMWCQVSTRASVCVCVCVLCVCDQEMFTKPKYRVFVISVELAYWVGVGRGYGGECDFCMCVCVVCVCVCAFACSVAKIMIKKCPSLPNQSSVTIYTEHWQWKRLHPKYPTSYSHELFSPNSVGKLSRKFSPNENRWVNLTLGGGDPSH